MAEKRSCSSAFVRDGTGGVVASNARSVSSLEFVRLDDMSMGILGTFSVINRLNDVAVGAILIISGLNEVAAMGKGCCRGRGSDWAVALSVVGWDLFLGLRNTPSDCSSSF
jgi:hypothetical protein